jgi:hypothetical protein
VLAIVVEGHFFAFFVAYEIIFGNTGTLYGFFAILSGFFVTLFWRQVFDEFDDLTALFCSVLAIVVEGHFFTFLVAYKILFRNTGIFSGFFVNLTGFFVILFGRRVFDEFDDLTDLFCSMLAIVVQGRFFAFFVAYKILFGNTGILGSSTGFFVGVIVSWMVFRLFW